MIIYFFCIFLILEFFGFSLDKELKTRATYQQLLEDPFIIKYTKEEVDVAGFVNEMLDQFDSQIVEMQRSMLGWVQNNA